MKKIESLKLEMEQTSDKIKKLQAKQRELEKRKFESENLQIVELVRGAKLDPEALAAFLEEHKTAKKEMEEQTHEA